MARRERGTWGAVARGVALAVGIAAALACSGLPFRPAVALEGELTGPERDAALALGETVDPGTATFPAEIATDCAAHARAVTWLAARATEPLVRAAALRAVAGCLAEAHPGDVAAVTLGAVGAEDRLELAAGLALAGARLALEDDGTVVGALLPRLADPDPAVRYDALLAVDQRSWGERAEVVAAVDGILRAPEPWLVTEALRRLRSRASGIPDPGGLPATLTALLGDIDPGIRGRAALALVRLTPADPALPDRLLGLLHDKHAYTRSVAAEALADLGYLPAAHALVAGLPDPDRNTWDMLAFTRLDGSQEVPRHVGSLYERVDDAFLRALARLTEPLGVGKFVYRDINLRYLSLDLIAATRDAARWYEAHRAALPPAPPSPPTE